LPVLGGFRRQLRKPAQQLFIFSLWQQDQRHSRTLGIQYLVIDSANQLVARIKDAVRMMHALKLRVALLFTGTFTG
jgi:hypothetical protein